MTLSQFEQDTDTSDEPSMKKLCIPRKEANQTGVKKVTILASAPGVSETYNNVSLFLQKVQTSQVWCTWTGDLKMANVMAGIMSCSSSHPCVYCETQCKQGKWGDRGTLRTVGSIKDQRSKWIESGGVKEKAKQFSNCVEQSLLSFPDENPETKILSVFPPPALHLKLVVNHFICQLEKVWPNVGEWIGSLNIKYEPYHGGCLGE